ncbi:hypothetical protein [Microvirga ossetica]|uniref:hypothetical protein n=1 Tax=Microvirga ossetica TaxID=1882682 RepID=UPI0012FFECC1|nr:hypothetical protein [Microvirga ossetica]
MKKAATIILSAAVGVLAVVGQAEASQQKGTAAVLDVKTSHGTMVSCTLANNVTLNAD